MKYSSKHLNMILLALLLIMCFILYFINMTGYAFLDTDETKFVSTAKEMLNYNDWINIRLNKEIILDPNPLLYWLINISCFICGKISAFAVRFPISLISCLGIIALFYTIRQILKRTYALIISFIFSLSIGILIFSKLATNDILSSFLIMFTILLSYLLLFKKDDKYNTLIWNGIFALSALAVLSCGLFGFLIPLFSITGIMIFSGKTKKLIKPQNLIWGLLIFSIIVFPWNILMVFKHKLLYIKEYLSAYSILKYSGPKEFFTSLVLMFLLFLPWSFSFLWILGRRLKQIISDILAYFKDNSEDKLNDKWNHLKQIEKFLSVNTIVFFTSLIFALIWGQKYTYLCLFPIFPASCITGHYWYDYIVKKKHDKSIFFATLIPDLILIVCSLIALFGHNILNQWIYKGLNHLMIPLIVIFFIIPVIAILAVILKGRLIVFLSNIILMLSLSFIITPNIFNFITLTTGENDLITFAEQSKKDKVKLASFISSRKNSLVYYFDNNVKFYDNNNWDNLDKYLKENQNDYVVVEIKDLWDIDAKNIKYMLIDSGKRYCLIQYMPYTEQLKEDTTEPDVIIY